MTNYLPDGYHSLPRTWRSRTHTEDISPDELARRVAAFTEGS